MDKSQILEDQMASLARTGQEYYSALQAAEKRGLPNEFITDATQLLNQLSDGPDAGAIQAMKDADRDVKAVEEFIARWSDNDTDPGYEKVLADAKNTLITLTAFLDTVNSLSPKERAKVEAQAQFGRMAMGKGCLPVIAILIGSSLSIVGFIWGKYP